MGQIAWDVKEGASLLIGVEKAARLLIAEMDERLANRVNDRKVAADSKGIVVVCIITCAYFCEIALKTLHSSLNDGVCSKGHNLEKLYEEVEQAYADRCTDAPQRMEHDVLAEIKAYYAKIPEAWWPSSIRNALVAGAENFTAWRYGYMENKESDMGVGVPRQLFAIAVGIYIVCLKRNPILWAEPGQKYLVPDPEASPGKGFSVVGVE